MMQLCSDRAVTMLFLARHGQWPRCAVGDFGHCLGRNHQLVCGMLRHDGIVPMPWELVGILGAATIALSRTISTAPSSFELLKYGNGPCEPMQ